MNFRKITALCLALAATAALIGGCGDEDDGSSRRSSKSSHVVQEKTTSGKEKETEAEELTTGEDETEEVTTEEATEESANPEFAYYELLKKETEKGNRIISIRDADFNEKRNYSFRYGDKIFIITKIQDGVFELNSYDMKTKEYKATLHSCQKQENVV